MEKFLDPIIIIVFLCLLIIYQITKMSSLRKKAKEAEFKQKLAEDRLDRRGEFLR